MMGAEDGKTAHLPPAGPLPVQTGWEPPGVSWGPLSSAPAPAPALLLRSTVLHFSRTLWSNSPGKSTWPRSQELSFHFGAGETDEGSPPSPASGRGATERRSLRLPSLFFLKYIRPKAFSCDPGCCRGAGLTPGLGTSTCCKCGQKEKKSIHQRD